MNVDRPIRVGLIGLGGFGKFCLSTYAASAVVDVAAIADVNPQTAAVVANKLSVAVYTDPQLLIERDDIDIVHIITPPSTHYDLTMLTLQAGKHVLCEKPLALTLEQVDDMLDAAYIKNLLLPVNFMLRYVPLVSKVKQVITANILGKPLHAFFENYATDQSLLQHHWFWDKEKSGGIFVEHGVHFFNLYEHWFGAAQVLYAHAESRPETALEDRVFCLLRHDSGVLANHYHGFDQPQCLDRAVHRIVFENGDITINGWIPEKMSVHALLGKKQLIDCAALIPGGEISVLETFDPVSHSGERRQRVRIDFTEKSSKKDIYAAAIEDLLADQITRIRHPKHHRKVVEVDGRRALDVALQATRLARLKNKHQSRS